MVQGAGAEHAQFSVEVAADPGDFALGDAGVATEGLDQVVHAAGGHALHVCLHDDGVEGLVDASPAFQQRREEQPGADLGDRQVQVPGLRGQHLPPVPVAHRRAGPGVLTGLGADVGGGFGLDEFLQDPLGQDPDQLDSVRRTQ
ncbi:hypothetical protein QFZ82_000089 [Streptomyces sp. V4I23]|nr:hypothetical protein [Streptomyces sp. V4I23]MDQ1005605.1 hypothetical protein [Streptomyces sp. V4I23]